MQDEMRTAELIGPRRLVRRLPSSERPIYSLCTMVTRWDEYEGCIRSYRDRGFGDQDCEVLTIDNSQTNVADAYVALNEFLQSAQGDYIVLTHQDVLLLSDGRAELDARLDELSDLDPAWAVCGNAGMASDGWPMVCISHPYSSSDIVGAPFPKQVVSLDENFIVVRRVANLALSRDLAGYHFYGADLCTVADILGWHVYVIGFFLRHNSGGTIDQTYHDARKAIVAKYNRAFRPRWIHVITQLSVFASGRKSEVLTARIYRYLARQLGRWPKHHQIGDAARRARRDARANARNKA